MTLALAAPPTPGQVVIGVAAVLCGALLAATSVFLARRSGNWLHHVGTAAGVLIVAGVVGQRSADDGSPMGLWDAGIDVPVLGLRINPVTATGVILALLGLVLTLLFERVAESDEQPRPLVHRPLEDDDTI